MEAIYRVEGATAETSAFAGGPWLEPGYFETEINSGFFDTDAGKTMIRSIPMRRIGRLEDLDGPLLLLASDASRFMTGAAIPVDGGHLLV